MSATPYTLVLGLGVTGASVVRHLCRRAAGGGERVVAMDSRAAPPFAATLAAEFPALELHLGGFDAAVLAGARRIVASPGIADLDAITADARARGVAVLSDIDLFAELARAPVIGITGTNGKSTVTVLVGELLAAAGVRVAVGGNLGTPALDLLADDVECYVLELSSFQLDITNTLRCAAAAILNLSPDHLDRYGDMATYGRSKRRIHRGAGHAVFNRADRETWPEDATALCTSFGLDAPAAADFGVRVLDGARTLVAGAQALVRSDELRLRGTHNEENVLAALALVRAFGVAPDATLDALRAFAGLPHRCQSVATLRGVEFINDSKATNEGAALAALAGVGGAIRGRIVLIAGGDGKGTDFASLAAALPGPVRAIVTIGKDAPAIAAVASPKVPVHAAQELGRAVRTAFGLAHPGDCVLLAPACASLDQFRNFEQRGERFAEAVDELVREVA
jgi:UDP-N-acetylmuramoylalanine--D-glutamate ligase